MLPTSFSSGTDEHKDGIWVQFGPNWSVSGKVIAFLQWTVE